MGSVSFVGHYNHIEAVRFDENTLATQVILFRFELEGRLLPVQTGDHDPRMDRLGIDRFAITVGVETILWRHAVLEYRDFDGEIAIPKHSAVMRPALVIAFRRGLFLGGPRIVLRLPAGVKCCCAKGSKEEMRLAHDQYPPTMSMKRPVNRP